MIAIRHGADSRRHAVRLAALLIGIFCAPLLHASDRKIDPTFLYRDTSVVREKKSDITTKTCHYRALFGQGDSNTSVVVGVARYGEVMIDPDGVCGLVQYPDEDQVYVVLEGTGSMKLNCTVGYYSAANVKSRILAVRSWYPGMVQIGAEH